MTGHGSLPLDQVGPNFTQLVLNTSSITQYTTDAKFYYVCKMDRPVIVLFSHSLCTYLSALMFLTMHSKHIQTISQDMLMITSVKYL